MLVTKDRLLRFGSELLFRICEFFRVEVVVLDAIPDVGREQQLTEDLVEILTVFPSRLYGSRSRRGASTSSAKTRILDIIGIELRVRGQARLLLKIPTPGTRRTQSR